MTCGECTDGWILITTRSGAEAVKACPTCRPPKRPETGTPLTEEDAIAYARKITSVLSFAPENDLAQLAIAHFLIDDLCQFKEQAEWLARRVPQLHTKWDACGLPGLRQIFCARYERPKDGLIITSTAAYPDGIPADRPQPQFEPPTIALPPAQVTANGILEAGVKAAAHDLADEITRPPDRTPRERRREQEFAGILEAALTNQADREPTPAPIPPSPRRLSEVWPLHPDDEPHNQPRPAGSYQPITAADIERELNQRDSTEEKA